MGDHAPDHPRDAMRARIQLFAVEPNGCVIGDFNSHSSNGISQKIDYLRVESSVIVRFHSGKPDLTPDGI
jgi:hypothetical protein